MGGASQHWFLTCKGGDRVDQFVGAQGASAGFALVSVSSIISALGTSSFDVTVREELLGSLVVMLLFGPLGEGSVRIELVEEFPGGLVVKWGRGPMIDVESDPKAIEGLQVDGMIAVDDGPGIHALLFGLHGDRCPVLVRTADEEHVFSFGAQVADEDVRREISSGDVADMKGAIGVGEGGGYRVALRLLHGLLGRSAKVGDYEPQAHFQIQHSKCLGSLP